jgi:hypothetical protein
VEYIHKTLILLGYKLVAERKSSPHIDIIHAGIVFWGCRPITDPHAVPHLKGPVPVPLFRVIRNPTRDVRTATQNWWLPTAISYQ